MQRLTHADDVGPTALTPSLHLLTPTHNITSHMQRLTHADDVGVTALTTSLHLLLPHNSTSHMQRLILLMKWAPLHSPLPCTHPYHSR